MYVFLCVHGMWLNNCICFVASALSYQNHTRVPYPLHASTNVIKGQQSTSTPHASTSRISTREEMFNSESIKPQQMILESPQSTHRRESGYTTVCHSLSLYSNLTA